MSVCRSAQQYVKENEGVQWFTVVCMVASWSMRSSSHLNSFPHRVTDPGIVCSDSVVSGERERACSRIAWG